MTTYKTNIRLSNAGEQDYERLDKEMETQVFSKFHCLDVSVKQLAERGREYLYRGSTSLQQITAAAYVAARNTGKEYRFTIIKQKGA
jgi:hypothetical protein